MATSMRKNSKTTGSTTKKTTKTATKEVIPVVESAPVETKEVVEPVAPTPTKKKFAKDDYIACRSTTVGGLILEGPKTKDIYEWTGYGDVTEVQYQDLSGMVTKGSEYIFSPLFVVEDDDFIDNFPKLEKFYEDQYTIQDLEGIFKLDPRDMKATIEKLPKGAFNTLRTMASNKVHNGSIDSIRTIKTLDECFGTDLNLLSELAN